MRHPPTPPRRRTAAGLALAATLAAGAALAESGTTLKATEMRAEPLGSAEVVGKLGAKEPVEIAGRKGAWADVKNPAGQSGWVRLLNLRTGSADANAAGGGNALAAAFMTGSSGDAATTGVKGLSPDILRGASPMPDEVAQLDQWASNADEASLFALSGGLSAQSVDYLKEDRRSRRRSR